MDDAARLVPPVGSELVISTDTLVQGVHFLPDTRYEWVAQKLLRVNLSDLAAKAAEPWGWFLNIAWPPAATQADRAAFARGLALDQAAFGLRLFGGDTVRTPGPLTVSATVLGLAPQGEMVRRAGARAGDAQWVSGAIGDAHICLQELRAGRPEPPEGRHTLPVPRLDLRAQLRAEASAAADVSDGLLADAGRIAAASGLGVEVALEALPLSDLGRVWMAGRRDRTAALLELATAGDDYEVVCAARPDRDLAPFFTRVGVFTAEPGVRATFEGRPVTLSKLGWTHD